RGCLTFGTLLRRRHREAAMVANQPALEAMIDQPGVAVLAGEAMAAVAAERERRITAPIEEQERLLAARKRDLDRLSEPRRDEASARRAFAAQINRFNMRQMCAAETLGQMQPPIARAARVHLGFDRRCGGREHDRNFGDACAHHRHVARMIVYAVFLLV